MPPAARRTKPARRWRWADAGEWDAACAASPAATAFHAREWCELIARHDARLEARALAFELASGATAVIPLHWRRGALRRGPFARASSVHPGVYGGPIVAGRSLSETEWGEVLDALSASGIGRFECTGNVLDPIPPSALARVEREAWTTHVLDLVELGSDPLASYTEACRRAVRRAARSGVTCARASSAEAVREYYAVYQGSLERWGKERGYPRALFEDLLACGEVELWLARLASGAVAAGGVFAFSRAHCAYWQGAMDKDASEARPMNALIHALVREASARGCRLFDFNPSRGLAGVIAFKESFRARAVEFDAWRWTRPIVARARSLRRSRG